MESKIFKGWDCYTANYEYDEVKVIVMLHEHIEDSLGVDWENLMCVGHYIYEIYTEQFNGKIPEKEWMKIQGREEEGYIQAWLCRTIEQFIEYFHNRLF